jgi:predicted TIM-barrel enzyme
MDFSEKRILGMIHLSSGPLGVVERALQEINIYEEEGLYGCIIENYHGSLDDVISILEALSLQKRSIKIGINILPNEFEIAFELATKYTFIDFIQLDFVAGSYVKGTYAIGRKVMIFGGVWPKYYVPVEDSNLSSDIFDGTTRCDGIVVTGSGTGKETPLDKIKEFKESVDRDSWKGPTALIIGAGLDANNVARQLQYADGAIVGSCFKQYKRTQELVNRGLVREFMNEVKQMK